MDWHRLSLRVLRSDVARVEALLGLAGAGSIDLADAEDSPLLEPAPGETPLWPEVVVSALFAAEPDLDAARALLAASVPDARIEVAPLEANWQEAGRRSAPQRRFGRRLWLVPAESYGPDPAGAVVKLRMGFAFGTGEHPTTALCLEWLDAHAPADADVLDYGCGSGVLGLAALALGAKRVSAVDNDPQALVAARANAELNGVGERLTVLAPEDLPDAKVDLVLANILARPLLELRRSLTERVRPGGRIVLSGLLETQAAELLAAYGRDFDELDVAEREGWARIAGRRRAA
ncbi:MAG TPA: 50S ribosomal protein L11 methyltransferase [Gammaproteobacteria bacterium]|nr:50S ribosomal protein L11 methyltransferase [Gammaproteobacteria bacterium]